MEGRDFYKTLGVKRGATEAELKTAYRALAKQLHPDRNPGNAKAEERFKEVSEAYGVLSDKDKRALYDEFGELGLREGFDPKAYRAYASAAAGGGVGGPDLSDLFGGGGFVDFNFEDFFGPRGGRARGQGQPFARKGQDLRSEVTIDFRDAVLGCERELSLTSPDRGTTRSIKVRIPSGVRDQGKIRLSGQGLQGSGGGGPGDLLLTVRVREHPHFWQEEGELHLRLPVTPLEAYRGARVGVPTPHGEVQLTVPSGSQSGQKLRLRGKGAARKGRAGDLIVHVEVVLPSEKSAEVEEALEKVESEFTTSPRAGLVL